MALPVGSTNPYLTDDDWMTLQDHSSSVDSLASSSGPGSPSFGLDSALEMPGRGRGRSVSSPIDIPSSQRPLRSDTPSPFLVCSVDEDEDLCVTSDSDTSQSWHSVSPTLNVSPQPMANTSADDQHPAQLPDDPSRGGGTGQTQLLSDSAYYYPSFDMPSQSQTPPGPHIGLHRTYQPGYGDQLPSNPQLSERALHSEAVRNIHWGPPSGPTDSVETLRGSVDTIPECSSPTDQVADAEQSQGDQGPPSNLNPFAKHHLEDVNAKNGPDSTTWINCRSCGTTHPDWLCTPEALSQSWKDPVSQQLALIGVLRAKMDGHSADMCPNLKVYPPAHYSSLSSPINLQARPFGLASQAEAHRATGDAFPKLTLYEPIKDNREKQAECTRFSTASTSGLKSPSTSNLSKPVQTAGNGQKTRLVSGQIPSVFTKFQEVSGPQTLAYQQGQNGILKQKGTSKADQSYITLSGDGAAVTSDELARSKSIHWSSPLLRFPDPMDGGNTSDQAGKPTATVSFMLHPSKDARPFEMPLNNKKAKISKPNSEHKANHTKVTKVQKAYEGHLHDKPTGPLSEVSEEPPKGELADAPSHCPSARDAETTEARQVDSGRSTGTPNQLHEAKNPERPINMAPGFDPRAMMEAFRKVWADPAKYEVQTDQRCKASASSTDAVKSGKAQANEKASISTEGQAAIDDTSPEGMGAKWSAMVERIESEATHRSKYKAKKPPLPKVLPPSSQFPGKPPTHHSTTGASYASRVAASRNAMCDPDPFHAEELKAKDKKISKLQKEKDDAIYREESIRRKLKAAEYRLRFERREVYQQMMQKHKITQLENEKASIKDPAQRVEADLRVQLARKEQELEQAKDQNDGLRENISRKDQKNSQLMASNTELYSRQVLSHHRLAQMGSRMQGDLPSDYRRILEDERYYLESQRDTIGLPAQRELDLVVQVDVKQQELNAAKIEIRDLRHHSQALESRVHNAEAEDHSLRSDISTVQKQLSQARTSMDKMNIKLHDAEEELDGAVLETHHLREQLSDALSELSALKRNSSVFGLQTGPKVVDEVDAQVKKVSEECDEWKAKYRKLIGDYKDTYRNIHQVLLHADDE